MEHQTKTTKINAVNKVEKAKKVDTINAVEKAKKIDVGDTVKGVEKSGEQLEQQPKTIKKKKQVPLSPNKHSEKKEGVKKQFDKTLAPNWATARAGCTLNVNFGKKHLKKYIEHRLGLNCGTVNAQYAYVAIIEFLLLQLVRLSGRFNKEQPEKANLFEVTLENVQRGMRESKEFGDNTSLLIDKYDVTIDYTSLFFQSASTLREFIEKKAFVNTNNIVFAEDALNFVCHVVLYLMSKLTKLACAFSGFAKKNSTKRGNIGIKNYIFACDFYFEGETNNLIHQRLSEIDSIFTKKKEDKDEKDEADKKETDDDEAEVETDEEEDE